MEELLVERPNDPVLRRALALLYQQAGRVEDAVAQLNSVAESLLSTGQKEGAMAVINQILFDETTQLRTIPSIADATPAAVSFFPAAKCVAGFLLFIALSAEWKCYNPSDFVFGENILCIKLIGKTPVRCTGKTPVPCVTAP